MKWLDIPQLTRSGNWECSYDIVSFVKQIEGWIEQDNLELDPDFQRGHVWTEEQQIKYVEYILRGGTTGITVYLNHPGWMGSFKGGMVCVDGLQRITAIQKFVSNELKVYGHYFNEFEGNPPCLTKCSVQINVNNLKTRKEVLQWYLELNSGGTVHTKEELDKVKVLMQKEDSILS